MAEKIDTILSLQNVGRIYPRDISDTPMAMLREMLLPRALLEDSRAEDFFALKNINLELKKGQKIGIIGSHRSGKSTLAAIASGLFLPTSGKVIATGSRLLLNRPTAGFKPTLTVYENLTFRASLAGLYGQELTEVINATLSRCSLSTSDANIPIGNISPYLSKQLGMTLLLEIPTDILIIDELSGAGVREARWETRGHLQNKIENCSALIISSDPNFLNDTTEQSLILHNGQIYGPFTTQTAIEYYHQLPEEDGYQLVEYNPMTPPSYNNTDKYLQDNDTQFAGSESEKSEGESTENDFQDSGKQSIKSQSRPVFTVSSLYVDDNKYSHSEYHLFKKQGENTTVEIVLLANFDVNSSGGQLELIDGNTGIIFASSSVQWPMTNICQGKNLKFTFTFEIPKHPSSFCGLSFTPFNNEMKPDQISRIKILIYGIGYAEKQLKSEIRITSNKLQIL